MCTRAYATTTELEPTDNHGVLHAPTAAHDETTSHDTTAHDKTAHDTTAPDKTAHDTTAHDTATTTTVRRHDDDKSTIHRQP